MLPFKTLRIQSFFELARSWGTKKLSTSIRKLINTPYSIKCLPKVKLPFINNYIDLRNTWLLQFKAREALYFSSVSWFLPAVAILTFTAWLNWLTQCLTHTLTHTHTITPNIHTMIHRNTYSHTTGKHYQQQKE